MVGASKVDVRVIGCYSGQPQNRTGIRAPRRQQPPCGPYVLNHLDDCAIGVATRTRALDQRCAPTRTRTRGPAAGRAIPLLVQRPLCDVSHHHGHVDVTINMAATPDSSAAAARGPQQRRGDGKVCLLTGASAGLGKVAAHRLAAEGFHLFLACRNEAKTQPVRAAPPPR
jgi:hypothetical protein